MSVSFESLDSGLSGERLVKMEAILNCKDKTYASFLCILGLSSVTNRNISVMYPDCGELRFKILFNQRVNPRLPLKCKSDDLHILYCCYDSVPPSQIFKPNHFVLIIFGKIEGKGVYHNQIPRNF